MSSFISLERFDVTNGTAAEAAEAARSIMDASYIHLVRGDNGELAALPGQIDAALALASLALLGGIVGRLAELLDQLTPADPA